MKKILLATDGTASSVKAVNMVAQFLEAWPKAECVVLYVSRQDAYVPEEGLPDTIEQDENRYASEIQRAVREEWLPEDADRIRFLHEWGQPALAIVHVAEAEGADIVVVGSHGRGEVDRLLLGSTSHGVVYCARMPVLVVKD